MYVFDVLPVINGVARTCVSCSTQFTTSFKPPDMALHGHNSFSLNNLVFHLLMSFSLHETHELHLKSRSNEQCPVVVKKIRKPLYL